MKNEAKSFKQLLFSIAIFVLSIIPNSVFAQQQNYQDIVNRIDEIDFEINKRTLLREVIGMDFEKISDFSTTARSILVEYNELTESLKFHQKSINLAKEALASHEINNNQFEALEKDAQRNLQYIYTRRENLLSNLKISSFFGNQCETVEDLQKEYNKTAEYYLEQKKEYDKIAEELGKLNTEKHDLETKLKYLGDQSIGAMDPTGCWTLAFGNHISVITIEEQASGKYVGTLTVNELENYEDGQVVLILDRVSDNTFRGIEYTWEEKPNGMLGEAKIPAMITINTDNRFLTWTSDQTVTMSRCQ